jgi:hypothetical protein
LVAYLAFVAFYQQGVGTIKKADVTVAVVSQKCNRLLEGGSVDGFCKNKIEASSDNYYNCPYAVKNFGVTLESEAPDCEGSEIQICNLLKASEKQDFQADKTFVNEKACSEIASCKALGGEFAEWDADCPDENVVDGVMEKPTNEGDVCCSSPQ